MCSRATAMQVIANMSTRRQTNKTKGSGGRGGQGWLEEEQRCKLVNEGTCSFKINLK